MSNGYTGPTGPPSTAWLLLHEYNLDKVEHTKYEPWDLGDSKEMLRLANVRTPMNILVIYEPEE